MAIPIKIVKYNISDIKKLKSMADFYDKVGLTKDFKSGLITHVQQIHMESNNCNSLSGIMISTLKKSRKYKMFTDRYINTAVGMDCLDLCPVSNDKVPEDEIWIYEEPTYLNET